LIPTIMLLLMGTALHAGADDLIFFVDAVRENRIDEVKELLRDGADVNTKDMFGGNTGLHWAARQGAAEMARLLIDNRANPNARNDNDETPLHWAAAEGHKEIVVMLIARGAKINAAAAGGETPLRRAQAHKQDEIARILIAAGARR